MRPATDLQKDDAKRIMPPAAHRADRLVKEFGGLTSELEQLMADIDARVKQHPHDKAEIQRLLQNLKQKAMTLHGQAVQASLDIDAGR
ncbi:hypothetical protein [uncultured Roseibium sp.]|uniref:hypothetical protein n=1 Tax=uncultured Roseibium sp. TaxID=1936171 RepID=UPI0026042FF4|nr:hypothetical protein [uncultured Roseibium sp.]